MPAGAPPALELAHLELGPDGHPASLVPGDAVLGILDMDVGLTGPYQDRRRMTLTHPIIARSRCVLWVVISADKAAAFARLRTGDRTLPGGRG